MYNKIIVQFVEETNLRHGLNLNFTKLEAPEVDIWVKTFQVAGHNEDQQVPKQLVLLHQSEPPQQQLHQHTQVQAHKTSLLTDKPPLAKQWMETY